MRQLTTLVTTFIVTAGVAAAAPVPATGPAPWPGPVLSAPLFVLTGGGWGHGVGMSQYGAFAQATAGRSYRDILGFYYQGTEIGSASLAKVRVLVAAESRSVRVGSAIPFRVRDALGVTYELPPGEVVLKPSLRLKIDGIPKRLVSPVVFQPGKGAPLALAGKEYRGELHATLAAGRFEVVDYVGLEAYLLGVVPGEVPKEWPAEALKAQAVAARSYALANIIKDKPWDLYADVRSQVYGGVALEAPSTSAAVKATRGEVLTFGGKVATTYYSSSSGGRTAASQDVFGIVSEYLRSVDDPWDTVSPNHRWPPRTFTAAGLAKAFGLASPIADVVMEPTPSGRPATVTLTTKAGRVVELPASEVRSRLHLRSTAFRLGVLRLGRTGTATAAGTAVRLTGVARDVEGAVLEKLGEAGVWAPAARLVPKLDGSFTVTLRPTQTSTYRLSVVGASGPALRLTVVPRATG